jgi:hypothetical protein
MRRLVEAQLGREVTSRESCRAVGTHTASKITKQVGGAFEALAKLTRNSEAVNPSVIGKQRRQTPLERDVVVVQDGGRAIHQAHARAAILR